MLSNFIKVFIGIAIGVWIADTNPEIANSVRGISNTTINAAEQVLKENPDFANSVHSLSQQGMDAAGVVLDKVNESKE